MITKNKVDFVLTNYNTKLYNKKMDKLQTWFTKLNMQNMPSY